MFGTIENIQIAILILALGSATTDIIHGKIYNWWTVPFAIAGLAYGLVAAGGDGLLQAFLGLLAGLGLYGGMMAVGILGGGDVKFLMALGAWGGPRYAGEVALAGVIFGGLFSVIILVWKGRTVDFLQRMYLFLSTFQVQMPNVDKKLTMPMGIPIAIAAIWVTFYHPFRGTLW